MFQGTKNNPVNLDSDDENEIEDEKQDEKRKINKNIINRQIKSDFDAKVNAIRQQTIGDQRQKNEVLINRIKKFFSSEVKTIDPSCQSFRQRREPNYSSEDAFPVPTQLIIYGIDFLKTRQIRQRFKDQKIQIKFLDDSHCKLIFEDEANARAGFEANLRDTPENKIKLQTQQIEVPRGWFQFEPYNYMNFERKVWCRYAASYENDEDIEKSNQQYKMKEAKRLYEMSCARAQDMQLTQLNLMKNFNFQGMPQDRSRRRNNNNFDRSNFNGRENYRDRNSNYNNYNRYSGNRNQYQEQNYSNRRSQGRNYNNKERNHRQISKESQSGSIDRSRTKNNKNKKDNNKDNDNLSIISRSMSQIHRIRQQSLSVSIRQANRIQNQNKQKADDQDDRCSNLSFLLNKSQASNISVINNLNNMKLNEDDHSIIDEDIKIKQKQHNLSVNSQIFKENKKVKKQDNDTSLISQNQQQKKSMKKVNTSLIVINDND